MTGIHQYGFDRLVRAVDELAGAGRISDVFIQTGSSSYRPKNCAWERAMDTAVFESRVSEADIIISHGGAGCVASALERNKPAILVPRLMRYGEHHDDHQLELIRELEKAGRVIAAYDVEDLPRAVEKAKDFEPRPSAAKNNIAQIIRNFLDAAARQKGCFLKKAAV